MCRSCDVMVHSANQAIGGHQRHLLSGWVLGLHAAEPAGGPDAAPIMPITVPVKQEVAPPPTKTSRAARADSVAPRVNGAADYEDYGALRALLGYPATMPGAGPGPSSLRQQSAAPAPRRASDRAPARQQRQQQHRHNHHLPTQVQRQGSGGGQRAARTAAAAAATAAVPTLGPSSPVLLNINGHHPHHHASIPQSSAAAALSASASSLPTHYDLQLPDSYEVPGLVTLTAAELLGMPLAEDVSAKDVDAVLLPDSYNEIDDFDLDFSSLFAVPDFGPPSSEGSFDYGVRFYSFRVCETY